MKKTLLLAFLLMFISALFASPPLEIVKNNKNYIDIGYVADIQLPQTVINVIFDEINIPNIDFNYNFQLSQTTNYVPVAEIYTDNIGFAFIDNNKNITEQAEQTIQTINYVSIAEIYMNNIGYTSQYGNVKLLKSEFTLTEKSYYKYIKTNYRHLHRLWFVPTNKIGIVELSSKYCLNRL